LAFGFWGHVGAPRAWFARFPWLARFGRLALFTRLVRGLTIPSGRLRSISSFVSFLSLVSLGSFLSALSLGPLLALVAFAWLRVWTRFAERRRWSPGDFFYRRGRSTFFDAGHGRFSRRQS
jgi:hypothetical protein